MNSFQSSPKHMVELKELGLGQVTFDKRNFMTFKVTGVLFVNGDGPNFKIKHGCMKYPLPM